MKWTEDEIATLRRMTAAGYADQAIADHIGKSRSTVTHKRLALKIAPGTSASAKRALSRVRWTRRNPRHAA